MYNTTYEQCWRVLMPAVMVMVIMMMPAQSLVGPHRTIANRAPLCRQRTANVGVNSAVSPAINKNNGLLKKCYGVYGCFALTTDWFSMGRPISVLPQSPRQIGVKFCHFSAQQPSVCQPMFDHNESYIANSTLLPATDTKFIVHGYLDSGEKRWIKRMVAELLSTSKPLNVIVVDWVGGSGPPYTQAVANIRVVGAVLGHFILTLKRLKQISPHRVHVIGHSLGAHLAGYVGSYLQRSTSTRENESGSMTTLGRITGLDPAEPHFEWTAPVVRLDPSDARLVDVIHTDSGPIISGGLGLVQSLGHMDFFPNGGMDQPGCGTSVFDAIKMEAGSFVYGIRRFIGCNHLRAYEYFTESINHEERCNFIALECENYERFKAGRCGECRPDFSNCHYMGYHADVNFNTRVQKPASTTYFLLTGNNKPFCRTQYRLTVRMSSTKGALSHGGETGRLYVRSIAQNATTDWQGASDRDIFYGPGGTYRHALAVPWLNEEPQRIEVRWKYTSSPLNPLTWRFLSQPSLYVSTVTLTRLDNHKRYAYCGGDDQVPLLAGHTLSLLSDTKCRNKNQAGDTVAESILNLLTDAINEVGDSVMKQLIDNTASARSKPTARSPTANYRQPRHHSAIRKI